MNPPLSPETATIYRRHELLLVCTFILGLAVIGCTADRPENEDDDLLVRQRVKVDPAEARLLVEAQDLYRRGSYQEALGRVDRVLAAYPDLSDGRYLRARIFSSINRFEEAREEYEELESRNPDYPGLWLSSGNDAFRRGKYQEALARYRREARRRSSERVWRNIGRAHEKLGHLDSARIAYERAIESDSSSAAAHVRLGQVLEQLGRLGEALRLTRFGVALTPDRPQYRYLLGHLLLQKGRPHEAVQVLDEVVAERPHHADAQYALGRALLRVGRTREGRRHVIRSDSLRGVEAELERLRTLVRSQPERVEAWVDLARQLRASGRLSQATQALHGARAADPGNARIANNLALLWMERGRMQRARRELERIVRRDSTLVSAWVNLGIVRYQMGARASAVQAFRHALKIDPHHRQAQAFMQQTAH